MNPALIEELEFRACGWPATAAQLTINDQANYERAADYLTTIKALRQEIAEACDPLIEATHKAHAAAVQQKRSLEAELVQAETILKRGMSGFVRQQEEAQRIERERLRREAERQAEEQRLAEAAALEEAGDHEAADAVLEVPAVPVAVPAPPAPKAEGVTTRKRWSAECVNLRALCAAVAADENLVALVQPNQSALNKLAGALKEHFKVPGCRATYTLEVAARARGQA